MKFCGDPELPSKLDYACYVAASLSYLILRQRDAVGLVTFDDKIRKFIPPGSSPSHRNLILNALNTLEPRERDRKSTRLNSSH